MRIAALYDIHGNLPALEAVLHKIRQEEVGLIVIGGDVVPGPMPLETFRSLLALEIPTKFIVGNTDREVLSQMDGVETAWFRTAPEPWREPVRWTSQKLQPEHKKLIAGWSATYRLEFPTLGNILFCHATPRNDTDIFTRLTSEDRLLPIFKEVEDPIVVCGHTHMQFDRKIGEIRVVNAGSVGMPFGETGAQWLFIDREIELRKTEYDLEEAADRIRDTSYPQAEDFATQYILNPPSEEVMLEVYEKVELKHDG